MAPPHALATFIMVTYGTDLKTAEETAKEKRETTSAASYAADIHMTDVTARNSVLGATIQQFSTHMTACP